MIIIFKRMYRDSKFILNYLFTVIRKPTVYLFTVIRKPTVYLFT